MIERRAFIASITLGLLTAPRATEAQRAKVFRIVVLGAGVNPRSAPFFVAFERRLRELGYLEGQNLALEYRQPEKGKTLDDIARQIVRELVDVIVVTGPEPPLKAAWTATRRIPIVMVAVNYDPVQRGYIATLARPGGNVTGVSYQQLELSAKQLELLIAATPGAGRVGVLWESFVGDQRQVVEIAARSLGIEVLPVEVPPPYDYERAFATLRRGRLRGVVVLGSPVFYRDRARIQDLARREHLATTGTLAYADAGALLAYGPDLPQFFARAADYVDRVLKGANPADLPVEQPTKFELVINLKTAKGLGLTIPPALLQRADQVIE